MSYKNLKIKDKKEVDRLFTDSKLSETINLRVTKALYFTLQNVAERKHIPLSEYARFLIEWHMSPAIIKTNLLFGSYSPRDAEESIAKTEERLDSLLSDLQGMRKLQEWAENLKKQIAELRGDIKTVLSGATLIEVQEIIKMTEKTNEDFMESYFEMTKKRKMNKKSKK